MVLIDYNGVKVRLYFQQAYPFFTSYQFYNIRITGNPISLATHILGLRYLTNERTKTPQQVLQKILAQATIGYPNHHNS